MRHRRRIRRLGMKTAHREAMLRNMVTSLFEHGRIRTTVPRAKELRRIADTLVTRAKKGSLHDRRQALSVLRKKHVVAKLFDEIAARFRDRAGGYTRIVRIGPRRGDAASMALVELAFDSLRPGRKSTAKKGSRPSVEDVIPMAKPSKEEDASKVVAKEEATPPKEEEDANESLKDSTTGTIDSETPSSSEEGVAKEDDIKEEDTKEEASLEDTNDNNPVNEDREGGTGSTSQDQS